MKKMLVVMMMTVTTFSLSACSSAPDEDAETVLKKAWENFAIENEDIEMGTAILKGKGDLAFAGNKAGFDGSLDAKFDVRNSDDEKAAIKLDMTADGNFEGQSGKVGLAGEVRVVDKTSYFFLESFSLDTGNAETDLMANFAENFFKSKWISIKDSLFADESTDETELYKELPEIIKRNQFLDIKEDLGNRKYAVKLNTEKLKTFLLEISKDSETPIDPIDLKDLDDLLATLDYDLYLKIDTEYKITWMKGTMTIKDPDGSDEISSELEMNMSDNSSDGNLSFELTGEEPGSFNLEFSTEHDESAVTIEAPKDAEEFDPSSFLGLGGGLGGGLGTTTDNDLSKLPLNEGLGL
jgi:hypothetical protein